MLSDFPYLDCSISSQFRQHLSSLPTQQNSDFQDPNTLKSYDYSEKVFDFDDFKHNPGMYRLGNKNYILNPPKVSNQYANVLITRNIDTDTASAFVFPYEDSIIYFRNGNPVSWADRPWRTLVTDADIAPKTKTSSSGTRFVQVQKIVYVHARFSSQTPFNQSSWEIIDYIPDEISKPAHTTQFPIASFRPNNVAYGEVRPDGTVRIAVYFDTSSLTQLYANFWYIAESLVR